MINQEQKELADYLKQVHLSLRRKSRQIGAENAWREHLQNEHVLRRYAFCMRKLAEEYWSVNNRSDSDTFLCRIEWIVNNIITYFRKGGILKEIEKEFKKLEFFVKKRLIDCVELHELESRECDISSEPYKLLDVGSCYNPFGKFSFLEVYPIDLYPANEEVKKCNFIEAEVVNMVDEYWFFDNLRYIQACYFDVVVFSLYLEYLPSPKQRYISCLKAYECLKTNGILLIVTPDSKHASANARLMKIWKIAAAQIGFVRIRLEKLKYIYCMAFRKSICRKYPLLLNNIKVDEQDFENMFLIPQDSVDYLVDEKIKEKTEEEEEEMKTMFDELPFP